MSNSMDNEKSFLLNGKKVTVTSDLSIRLLDVLREELGMVSVKEGCGEGECGACSVLLDHKIINSCITPLGLVVGREVTTIDGIMTTTRGKAILKAFEDFGSVQCGICTPGMVVATESLLTANPNPTEEEIRVGLSGNLCRCTGYNMIVQAIKDLVKKEGQLW